MFAFIIYEYPRRCDKKVYCKNDGCCDDLAKQVVQPYRGHHRHNDGVHDSAEKNHDYKPRNRHVMRLIGCKCKPPIHTVVIHSRQSEAEIGADPRFDPQKPDKDH